MTSFSMSALALNKNSPWSSKNLIDRNQLKKFMQVWIDELCMCTNFGGRSFFGFGDIAILKNGQISLPKAGHAKADISARIFPALF